MSPVPVHQAVLQVISLFFSFCQCFSSACLGLSPFPFFPRGWITCLPRKHLRWASKKCCLSRMLSWLRSTPASVTPARDFNHGAEGFIQELRVERPEQFLCLTAPSPLHCIPQILMITNNNQTNPSKSLLMETKKPKGCLPMGILDGSYPLSLLENHMTLA